MARRGQAAPARGGRLEKKIEKRGINGASFMVVVVTAGEFRRRGPREGQGGMVNEGPAQVGCSEAVRLPSQGPEEGTGPVP